MNLFSRSSRKIKKPVHDEEPPPRSPPKTSPSKSKSARATKDENSHHNHHNRPSSASARSSPGFTKSFSNSPKYSYDPTTHPLNLPPEVRNLRRSSTLSNMADTTMPDADAPSSPQSPMPGSFDTQKVNGSANGEVPAPPPHKSSPSSPVAAPVTPEEAETFKNEGNTFFKNKEYRKAIESYTKGMTSWPWY